MASTTRSAPAAAALPDYAPVPHASFGPAVNEQGYYVGRVERNLYWVTDGDYNSAFMTTRDGVVLFDAPPSIGHSLQRAVDEVAGASGVSNKVTHLVYTHHHSDHAGGSSIFGKDVVRIGHEETRRLLLRDNDRAKPAPEETFHDRRTLDIGGERIELAWHGSNHTADNTYIHFPDHDTLMLVDIVSPGWVPFYSVNLSEDLPGWIDAPTKALSYPWTHFIGGHMGKLGTRDDVVLHQEYVADMAAHARTALATVDPTPYFQKYGGNNWAAVRGYLDAVTDTAAGPVIESTSIDSGLQMCSLPVTPLQCLSRFASTSATAWMSAPNGTLALTAAIPGGQALARTALRAGRQVVIANSRGPASVAPVVASLGEAVSAGTVPEAAGCAMVGPAVPWASVPAAVAGLTWDGENSHRPDQRAALSRPSARTSRWPHIKRDRRRSRTRREAGEGGEHTCG